MADQDKQTAGRAMIDGENPDRCIVRIPEKLFDEICLEISDHDPSLPPHHTALAIFDVVSEYFKVKIEPMEEMEPLTAGASAMPEPTYEMIAAGVAALNAHTSDERRVLPDEEIVETVWRAMKRTEEKQT